MFSQKQLQKLAVDLFNIGAIKLGNSNVPIEIDLNQLIFHQDLLNRLSTMLWLLTDLNEKYDRVCGVAYTAIAQCGVPYTAIMYAYQISAQTGIPMLVRRCHPNPSAIATNGNYKDIEGQFNVGDRVAIVEGELTNGTNILEAAFQLSRKNLKIGKALVVIDWEQGGQNNVMNTGITVMSLFKITQLIEYLREAGKIPNYVLTIRKDPNNVYDHVAEDPRCRSNSLHHHARTV